MASIGGDTNQLLRKFMRRGRRKPDEALTPYKPRKQGTVPNYKPRKQKTY